MQYKHKLTLGDWSGDGHGRTKVIHFSSNLTKEEIAAAYKLACKNSGIEFHDVVAAEYEDNSCPEDELRAYGVDNGAADGEFYIDGPWAFFDLLMAFLRVDTPSLAFEVEDGLDDLVYDLGNGLGYGLFYS